MRLTANLRLNPTTIFVLVFVTILVDEDYDKD